MSWQSQFVKLRHLLARKTQDRELAEEIRAHLEMEEQEKSGCRNACWRSALCGRAAVR